MSISDNINDQIIYRDGNDIIRIIDNFFSEDVLKKIIDYFNTNKWKCQCMKDPNINNDGNDSPYWRTELENETLFNYELKNIIEIYLNEYLHLDRIYAVGQTYGQDSIFHIDNEATTTLTICFYINTNNTYDYGGGLFYLKIPRKKSILALEPIHNRAIIFPSNYRHKGSGFNRFNNHFRICIAWKFTLLKI